MINSEDPATDSVRFEQIRQVVNDCVRRRSDGEAISDQSLIEAHPKLMPELADELRKLQLIGEAKRQAGVQTDDGQQALRIRCPHCHNHVEVLDDASLSDVTCPSCGSHFSLAGDEQQSFQAAKLESIGHFKLLDKLGVGAFGSVWSARDTELDRVVAVKIPRKGQMDAEDTEQFIREARAAAQLNHPNIVRVHEVGREGDRVYIVTDFVQGLNLADWLTDQQATPREAAELCATVADALHHAHHHGVIHRDLKPSNIMLDTDGEPHLMDFGLAKREAGEITMTVEGKLLGTPAYMPPEQARGSAHDADARSDVYSLGVILFELLTGERPFRGSTRMLLHQVLVEDAPSPRKLNGAIPKDLETICLKCLEKVPQRRYQTAKELADELRRFLEGHAVHARPITRGERSWRWCKRNPTMSTLAAALVLALFGGLIGVSSQWMRAHRYWRRAEANAAQATANATLARNEAERADKAAQRYRWLLYVSDMDRVREAWDSNDAETMLELLKRHRPAAGQSDPRGFEWYHLWHRCKPVIMAPTLAQEGWVCDVAFSSRGTLLTTASNTGIKRWTFAGKATHDTPIDSASIVEYSGKLSPDGSRVAYGHSDGQVTLMDVNTGATDKYQAGNGYIFSVEFSPDGETLATGHFDGSVKLWDASTYRPLTPIAGHDDRVYCMAFTLDRKTLATGSRDQTVKLWNVETGVLTKTLDLSTVCERKSSVWSVAISSDGNRLATGTSGDNVAILWDVASGQFLHKLDGHRDFVTSVTFSPDGSTLASAFRAVKLWDVRSGQLKATLKGATNYVTSLAFDHSGQLLASGTLGGVRLWNLDDTTHNDVLLGHADNVHGLAFSPSGQLLASGSHDGELRLWDLSKPNTSHSLGRHDDLVRSVSFSPDGRLVASSSDDRTVKVWDVATGHCLQTFEFPASALRAEFSAHGLLAVGTGDATITLCDAIRGTKIDVLKGHRDRVFSLAFSRDGRTLASGCAWESGTGILDDTVRIWDVKSGQTRQVLDGHTKGVRSISFSPDGHMLAVASGDGAIRLWDLGDRALSQETILTTDAHAHSVVFTPNGQSLICGGRDHAIEFWDVDSRQLRFRLPAHDDTIPCLAISRDGSVLATGSKDDTIKLWRRATDAEVRAAGW